MQQPDPAAEAEAEATVEAPNDGRDAAAAADPVPADSAAAGTDSLDDESDESEADGAGDKERLIYVADWRNDRVQVFDAEGRFITEIIGDATLSKWGITKLDANPDMKMQRDIAQGLEREKFMRGPMGVVVDDQDQVFIVDSQRNRIQIYRKIPPFFVGLYDGGRL